MTFGSITGPDKTPRRRSSHFYFNFIGRFNLRAAVPQRDRQRAEGRGNDDLRPVKPHRVGVQRDPAKARLQHLKAQGS